MISDNDSSVDIEAFGLESDDWLDRVRVAVGPPQMGTLGDYEIVEEVGYGGQGIVYRARQPRTNRDIALKRLRAGSLTGERARARFEREVEAASSLSHPNIVTVFGAEVIDNVPTLAMQWIDGVPIDEWATRTHASVPRRLGVFRKLCGAVQYAHQRGIIHRDLKPQNILVDDQDEPYVLDFGLAKLVLTDDTDHAVLTRPAEFVGTLAYAAPEQLESRPDEVDARADVYALGAVLYRVLTGNHPHDPGKPIAELIDQIRTRDVEAPSRSCADANHEIDAIVLKALRSDPRQRYQSVDALLADVKRYLSGDIVLALPPSALYQFRKLIRRHRVPFLIGAAASLAVVSLTIVLAFQTVKLTQSEDEQRKLTIDARKEEALAKAEAHKALATYEFIEQLLIRDDPFNELQPNARIKDILDDAVELLDGGAFAQQPEIEAALRLTVGRAYVALLYHSLAEQQLEVAAAMQRESYGESNPDYLMTFLHLIGSIHEQGRNEDAEVLLRRAVEVARALPRKHINISLNAQWMQCSLLRDLGKLDEAEAAGRQALSDATIEFGPGSVEAAQSHYMLGHCLKTAGRLRDAEAHLRSALAIQRELLGAEHARVLRTMLRLGQTIGEQARYDEAIAVFKQAHRISEKNFGPTFPGTARFLLHQAYVEQDRGELEASAELFQQTLEIHRAYYGDTPGGLREVCFSFAELRKAQGRIDEAITLMRLGIDDLEGLARTSNPRLWRAKLDLAALMEGAGRFAEAEPLILECYGAMRAGVCCQNESGSLSAAGIERRLIDLYAAWGSDVLFLHPQRDNALP